MLQVYTDGACNTNTKWGGWAFRLVKDGDASAPQGGSQENTTNQRMEVEAAIQALSHVPEGSELTLYSDSQYLVYSMPEIPGRKSRYRRRANLDLWERLDKVAAQQRVSWQWLENAEAQPTFSQVHQLAEKLAAGIPPPTPGKPVRMVDVSAKPVAVREAEALALVQMSPETLRRIIAGEVEKGDVLTAARISGIMAAKRTPELIPLCHPLLLDQVSVDCLPREDEGGVEVRARVRGEARTGYEMEALVAAAVAALTVYDMTKAYDPAMRIELRLLRKSGGKSGAVELG